MQASSARRALEKTARTVYSPVRKSSRRERLFFWMIVLSFGLGYGAAELAHKGGVEGACDEYQVRQMDKVQTEK